MTRKGPLDRTVTVSGTNLCPFSWIQVVERPGCLGGLFGAREQLVWSPQPCMGASCKLWNAERGDCGLLTKKP